MGRLSNERLEELMNASWRDLTQSERRSAMRELPADEHHSPDSKAMGITAECRQHPGKWRRLACFATRKQAQTRAAAIRRNKKTWDGVDARAIERDQRQETWISYQGDAK